MPSSTARACSIPPAALVRCSLIRRTSSIAPSARSTSARNAGASSPSTPPLAITTRARASEYATSSASRDPSSGSNTTNSLSPPTSRSAIARAGSISSDGTTQTP